MKTVIFAIAACGCFLTVAGNAPTPRVAEALEWKIDPAHSAANFAVRHLVVSTVRGKLGPVTGSVWYDGADASSIRADAKIDVNRLSTGDDSRDSDLRGPE